MRHMLTLLVLLTAINAQAVSLDSGHTRATTVELFTSEGCSSCPPADRWLSALRADPDLFSDLVPMAFHVDYWDRLGWRDPFGSAAFSQRQRRHRQQGNVARVYTPEVVVDNREWRGFFQGRRLPRQAPQAAGRLRVDVDTDAGRFQYQYHPLDANQGPWTLHFAYLLMGVCSDIAAGENRGRQLCHDFVVSAHRQHAAAGRAPLVGALALPPRPDKGQSRTAMVVWVSKRGAEAIEQVVAGYL